MDSKRDGGPAVAKLRITGLADQMGSAQQIPRTVRAGQKTVPDAVSAYYLNHKTVADTVFLFG